jgi:hypothetical protein
MQSAHVQMVRFGPADKRRWVRQHCAVRLNLLIWVGKSFAWHSHSGSFPNLIAIAGAEG